MMKTTKTNKFYKIALTIVLICIILVICYAIKGYMLGLTR